MNAALGSGLGWQAAGSGGGGGGAPTNATYILQTPNVALGSAQALSALATGILKSTTATGVVSIATPDSDYATPAGVVSYVGSYAVPLTAQVIAGTGLAGGGAFSGGNITLSLPATGPGAGLIGGSGIASITLDAQGRVTAAAAATYSPVLTFSNGLTRSANNVTNDLVTGVASNAGLTFDTASGAGGTFNTTTNSTKGVFHFGSTSVLDLSENLTYASGASVTLDVLSMPARTVVVTGSTSISTTSGFNYVTINPPLLSAASALTVTSAATLAVAGPPTAGGAGPLTLTNYDAFRVNGTWTNTAGTGRGISIAPTFAPTSGTGAFRNISAAYTINQTGGANGTVTGLLANGTETALVGVHNLLDLQVGGTSIFRVQSQGSTSAPNVLIGNAVSTVASTLIRADASRTVASATSAVWDGVDILGATLTLTGTTAVTTASGVNMITVRAPTITDSSSVAVTNAATMAVTGAPVAAGSATIANAYGFWGQSGIHRFDSALGVGVKPDTTNNYQFEVSFTGACLGRIGTTNAAGWAQLDLRGNTDGNLSLIGYAGSAGGSSHLGKPNAGSAVLRMNASANQAVVYCGGNLPLIFGTNSAEVYRITGNANLLLGTTTDVASTVLRVSAAKTVASASGAVWDGVDVIASTLTLSGNTNITTATGVNMVQFRAPTLSAASALTVTAAATVTIAGAPSGAGAGPCTITNAYALWVQGVTRLGAGLISDLNSRVTSTFTKSADTTLANVTGLTATLAAGATYEFEAVLDVTADATGGSQFAVSGTATATSIFYWIVLVDGTTSANTITSRQTALGGSASQAGTTSGICRIKGAITVNAGGTLTVQFAQKVATGASSVNTGSHFLSFNRIA